MKLPKTSRTRTTTTTRTRTRIGPLYKASPYWNKGAAVALSYSIILNQYKGEGTSAEHCYIGMTFFLLLFFFFGLTRIIIQ